MALIASILPPDNVFLDLDLTSKKRLFEQAGLLFENSQGIARSATFDALFAREKLGSTGLGQGVAIPHGRIKGIKQAVGTFVRLKTPIAFEAPDGKPVSLAFVLLVPEQATDLHLQILSELAQLFSDKKSREALCAATTVEESYRLLTNWQS
ncbi:PTS IIA-like nitrogen regulatory protein PtsN [Chitinimonas sp. BJB300]|uniref:PTS IIA-like nitrogen regulatory protein PtsN n=1 Tax=Chitinimonas sp. BJB300 TaxID=1559339 RepID=UPI000C0CF17F|nr:PTS IIA-like nitrogen regulatory protein PtsN [Chitinimonas sp. BJB300]PHV10661.1 PTS IIA-like nitrogen-regulatory protein PtsN [Chitinimonas sp. BJB300]TSJ91637.1 PTS IIA-like nitrogen regulatory protein PtsN [Chitinimonas sp. BJB300]